MVLPLKSVRERTLDSLTLRWNLLRRGEQPKEEKDPEVYAEASRLIRSAMDHLGPVSKGQAGLILITATAISIGFDELCEVKVEPVNAG